MRIEWDFLTQQQQDAEEQGWQCVTGGIILSPDRRVYVQKRSASKVLFPGGWDIVGGHVEAGESLGEALSREVEEETGWQLQSIDMLVQQLDWSFENEGTTCFRREFDFVISVQGDLENPRLEEGKFSEGRWLKETELEILKENRDQDDFMYELVKKVFAVGN